MQRFFNTGWTLSIFMALICILAAPVNTLYASEHSPSATARTSTLPAGELATTTPAENKTSAAKNPERKLSAFFKVGIAINIAMMLTFAWWAQRQWRMSTKNKDT